MKPFCEYCEQNKQHPIFVFKAASDDYVRIARSRNPFKAVEEFKATKGFARAKGFPRSVRRAHWKLCAFYGPFPDGVAARKFKRAWEHGNKLDMAQVQSEYNAKCFEVDKPQ